MEVVWVLIYICLNLKCSVPVSAVVFNSEEKCQLGTITVMNNLDHRGTFGRMVFCVKSLHDVDR